MRDGNWRMAAATALTAVVWFLRSVAIRPGLEALPGVGPIFRWLKTDRGGVVLALSVGVLGGIGTALFAHQHVSRDLIINGAIEGVLSAGIFSTVKKLAKPSDRPAPKIEQPDDPVASPTEGGGPA
jgi:hypothetical protein